MFCIVPKSQYSKFYFLNSPYILTKNTTSQLTLITCTEVNLAFLNFAESKIRIRIFDN